MNKCKIGNSECDFCGHYAITMPITIDIKIIGENKTKAEKYNACAKCRKEMENKNNG